MRRVDALNYDAFPYSSKKCATVRMPS
jgi:hypothetical protein